MNRIRIFYQPTPRTGVRSTSGRPKNHATDGRQATEPGTSAGCIKRRPALPGTVRFDGVRPDGSVVFSLTVMGYATCRDWVGTLERLMAEIDADTKLAAWWAARPRLEGDR